MTLNPGKRRSERKPAGLLDAVIDCDVHPGLKLRFQNLSGQSVNLGCRIIWVHVNRIPLQGLAYRIGVEITRVSKEYSSLVRALKLRYCEQYEHYPLNMGWIER